MWRIWNKNIDLLTLQALHSRLLAGIIQSWGFSVCFILVLSQSFHSHYTERALIFCLWSSKWKLMKKFSLILHFWGIYDIFFHPLSNLSLLKKEERLRVSSIVWENSLFTNIYDQDWVAVSIAWDPNEVLCVGKQWIYRNLHALNMYLCWNILLSDIASE